MEVFDLIRAVPVSVVFNQDFPAVEPACWFDGSIIGEQSEVTRARPVRGIRGSQLKANTISLALDTQRTSPGSVLYDPYFWVVVFTWVSDSSYDSIDLYLYGAFPNSVVFEPNLFFWDDQRPCKIQAYLQINSSVQQEYWYGNPSSIFPTSNVADSETLQYRYGFGFSQLSSISCAYSGTYFTGYRYFDSPTAGSVNYLNKKCPLPLSGVVQTQPQIVDYSLKNRSGTQLYGSKTIERDGNFSDPNYENAAFKETPPHGLVYDSNLSAIVGYPLRSSVWEYDRPFALFWPDTSADAQMRAAGTGRLSQDGVTASLSVTNSKSCTGTRWRWRSLTALEQTYGKYLTFSNIGAGTAPGNIFPITNTSFSTFAADVGTASQIYETGVAFTQNASVTLRFGA